MKTLIENHKSVKDQVQLINEADESPSLPENQKSSSNHLDTVQPLKASSSIEAVNLDSWPTSESSPDQDQWRSSTAKTAKIGVGTSALSRGMYVQLNEYETAPNFLQLSQNLIWDCLLI